ncbi:hypothetical protein [Endozoicomonas sp. GU-1]|uniref:hypothetical protein n=1 Tax=Endozoicomonas sp. GU-1 TaxID=3009078 RepID=UPI0022B5340E|nr:hypothetical protein [Endozoicomonas sp. GU-1]WBA80552.1 hypothetical protein O2T12_19780 [Endozoicomonas sp. GU-1]WBA88118.1 hypothetical protein O3276_08985 [Endozoicomonas sp. GU-1]
MKSMIAEVVALSNFLKQNFRTYNPDASPEQGELPYHIDTEQLSKRINKCNDLHQECVKAMTTCTNPATAERLMKASDFYKKFQGRFYKKVNEITNDISRQIAKELYSVSKDSDDDDETVSNNSTDDNVKNLLELVDQGDKTETALIMERTHQCFLSFVDPAAKSLKKKEQSEKNLFSKWCELFARSLSKILDQDQELDSDVLFTVKTIMAVFGKATAGQDNSMHLLAVLNQLNKKGLLDPKTSFTGKEIFAGHVIKACIAQLDHLNKLIDSKAKDGEPHQMELRIKDKFVNQLNALRPYFPEGDLYIEFILTLVVDQVDHNWFALLYALAHCPSEALSDQRRERLSQRLAQYHPQAQMMLDALLTGNHGQIPEVTDPDYYPVLWLKAFILNKQGEHHRAYEAIIQAESGCRRMPGQKQPDVRLQLEILRIKLRSQPLDTEHAGLSFEQLKTMKAQADNLISHPQAFWTQHEHTLLQQLRGELAALLSQYAPTVTESVTPASTGIVEDPPEEPDTLNTEADVVMPALPQSRKTLVKELCKKLKAGIRIWQGRNRPEPLLPDDSYQVMGPYGKTLSATETMRKDHWNCGIRQLLTEVNAHRAHGDIISELSCYQRVLADPTRKGTIGIYRLTLELSWTIMRYVNGEYGAVGLTDREKGELLDISWQSLKQSVCLAMRRNSPLPEQVSDQELVETVVQWLQLLKDPEAKKEMEFFMRCALGSTAGHIHGFLAEIFPRQKQHSDSARFFFEAKTRLQPDYQKPVSEAGQDSRHDLMRKNQQQRWSQGR